MKSQHPSRNVILFIGLFTVIFAPLSYGNEKDCRILLGGISTSKRAIQALKDAKPQYKISLLSKEINGQPRVVVLAGETHIKTKAGEEKGQELLNNFDLRGLEHAPEAVMKIARFVQDNLAKILRLRGSTLVEAGSLSTEKYLEFWAQALAERLREDGYTSDLSPEDEKDILSFFGEKEREISPEELLSLVKSYLEPNAKEPTVPTNVNLESGHTPSISPWSYAYIPGLILLLVTHSILSHYHLLPSGTTGHVVNFIIFLPAGYFIADSWLSPFSYQKWYGSFFPVGTELIHHRNVTMVKNIQRALGERSESQILVLVGRSHVKGMERLLKQDGFIKFDLDSIGE